MKKPASGRISSTPRSVRIVDKQPMVLLHGIWMTDYKSWEPKIYAAGFKFPAENGWGGEMFDFKDVEGKCYGHVEIIERMIRGNVVEPQLRIEALGAEKSADVVHDVLVIWTAPDPRRRGRTIVGWYKNATVYRRRQEPSGALRRKRTYDGNVCSYRVEAETGVLLPPEKRKLTIPPRKHGQKGGPGEFGAFYPASSGATGRKIEQDIRHFIETGKTLGSSTNRKGGGYQPDPARRTEIEDKAIGFVWDHFEKLDYTLDDHQKDNLGYDLIATDGNEILCIEVKGRSGNDVIADFSRNEYETILKAEKGRLRGRFIPDLHSHRRTQQPKTSSFYALAGDIWKKR
jgi:hypothetical protein